MKNRCPVCLRPTIYAHLCLKCDKSYSKELPGVWPAIIWAAKRARRIASRRRKFR